jgi:hypothetical protein
MNAYCVILRQGPLVDVERSRTKKCFLRAATADRAIIAAVEEDPGWRSVGVEPSSMFAPILESDRSAAETATWPAA